MIKEENSALVGRNYTIPVNIKQFLQTKIGEGGKRITGMINSPSVSYEALKRTKHDIESGIYQSDWTPVLNWINSVLGRDRGMEDNRKRTPMETGMENRFKKTHDKEYGRNLTPLSGKQLVKLTEEQYQRLNEYLIDEQNKTVCQTPDAQFHVRVSGKQVSCKVDLPIDLDLTEKEAKILETNIHNVMEIVLAEYFK